MVRSRAFPLIVSAFAALCWPASAQMVRASVDSYGAQANGGSLSRAISADGNKIVFTSSASNLVANDNNGCDDIFVHDRVTGATIRVSVDSAGNEANGASSLPAISPDGRFVAFASVASNLVAGDVNGVQDVFVHDLTTGATFLASVDSSGMQGDSDSGGSAFSYDGGILAFASNATNLVSGDTNAVQDIFVRDFNTGITERVSVSSSGAQANGRSIVPSITWDGTKVAFSSAATNLVSGDTNNKPDVFVRDRTAGTTIRASLNNTGGQGNGTSGDPEISADGTKVVFDSDSNTLVKNDMNGKQDVFLRDLVNNTTTRLSVDAQGNESDGDSYEASISADGNLVVFASDATNLVPGDTNGTTDIYLRALDLSYVKRISVSDAGVEADGRSLQPEISGDGLTVTFQSAATNLVAGDTNGLTDVFFRHGCIVKFQEYGTGLAGSGGFVPHLFGNGGNGVGDFSIHIDKGLGFAAGILWVGLAQADYFPVFGGHFYVSLTNPYIPFSFVLQGPVDQPGVGFIDFPGIDVSSVIGVSVFLQATIVDKGAVRGAAMSNGLEMDLADH